MSPIPPLKTSSSSIWLVPAWGFATSIVVAAGVVLWGYGDTCHYQFVFDDHPGIVSNPSLKAFVESGMSRFGELLGFSGERILTFLTFAWSWRISGLDPCAFRLVNLVLHVVASVLAGGCAVALHDACGGRVSKRRNVVMLVAVTALFAAHPIQTQAVTYIYQRLAVLCAALSLASFLLALRWIATGIASLRVYSIVFLSLALVSKPNAVMLPIMVICAAWCFCPERISASLAFLLPTLVVPALMGISGGSVAGRVAGHGTAGLEWWHYFLTQGRVLWKYVGLIFWPAAQSVDHVIEVARSPFSAAGMAGLAGWILVAVIVTMAIRYCRRAAVHASAKMAWFGVLWFLGMLMVESSVIPIRDVMMEHRVFLPFAGICWIVGAMILVMSKQSWFLPRWKLVSAVSALVVISLASLTEIRNRVWEDPRSLWSSALLTDPSSARARLNLGNALLRDGRFGEALQHYDQLVKSGDLRSDALYQRSLALILLTRIDEASSAVEDFAHAYPDDQVRTAYLRGWLFLASGQYGKAFQYFSDVASPSSADGPLQRAGRMGMARAATRLSLAPAADGANLVWRDKAMSTLRDMVKSDPADLEARVRLVRILGTSGKIDEATRVAIQADGMPGPLGASGVAWLALAAAEVQEDPLKPDAALEAYRDAMVRYPDHKGLQIWHGSFLATLGDQDRIHQVIGGTSEIDELADHAMAEALKLEGALQSDEAVNILRRVLLLCESGARKCSRQARLLKRLGEAMMIADPDARGEAEGLISRGRALDPGDRGTAP